MSLNTFYGFVAVAAIILLLIGFKKINQPDNKNYDGIGYIIGGVFFVFLLLIYLFGVDFED